MPKGLSEGGGLTKSWKDASSQDRQSQFAGAQRQDSDETHLAGAENLGGAPSPQRLDRSSRHVY